MKIRPGAGEDPRLPSPADNDVCLFADHSCPWERREILDILHRSAEAHRDKNAGNHDGNDPEHGLYPF